MRSVALLLVGLAGLALAPRAAAQPQAARPPRLAPDDSVRVERVLDGLQLDRQTAASLVQMAGNPLTAGVADRVTPAAIRAAVRARLAAGYSRERADAVLAAIADSTYDAYLDRLMALQGPDATAHLVTAMLGTPKKGTLGDSLMALRFVRASGLVDYTRETLRRTFEGVVARVPAARDDLVRNGVTLEGVVEDQVASVEPHFVTVLRLAAPRASADAAAALAFAESDGGRYAVGAVFGGLTDAYVPALVDALAAMAEASLPPGSPAVRPPGTPVPPP